MKKENDIVGTWLLVKFLYIRNENYCHPSRGTCYLKKRYYWLVECTNCKDRKEMEESNMKPPAGGKCQHCWGYEKGYSGFREILDRYTRVAKKLEREFSLSEDEFKFLTSGNCHYCGSEPFKTIGTKAQSS